MDDLKKLLWTAAAYFLFAFITGLMKKKKKTQEESPPSRRVQPQPVQEIVEKAIVKPKIPKSLTEEVNPFFIPKKTKKSFLKGKSKREAFILSEILRNPHSH